MNPVAPTLPAIKRALLTHDPKRILAEGVMKQAAVAAVLRETRAAESELLFIRRAEHPKDPWSGHMAFPGGRVDPEDPSAYAASLRETREELGLDLAAHGSKIGELSHLMAIAHGKPLPMVIVPYVFELASDQPFVISDEVQEALWVPVSFLADEKNRSTLEWKMFTMPCYRYEGRVIWGLTLKMVDELLALA